MEKWKLKLDELRKWKEKLETEHKIWKNELETEHNKLISDCQQRCLFNQESNDGWRCTK